MKTLISPHNRNVNNPDERLAAFLNELRPQSLETFNMFSHQNVGLESFHAFSCHGESLVDLKIDILSSDILPKISLLKRCTNLVLLSLDSKKLITIDLQTSHYEAFLETVAWLKKCKKLRNLAFIKVFSTPALMTPMLLESSIQLHSLLYEGSATRDTKNFHQALANQKSLQKLWLKEDEDKFRSYPLESADVLVETLSKLVNLTDLRLEELSDIFVDQHIMRLASSLPNLETLWTRGCRLTDAIWDEVASLKSLQSLDLGASTSFTAQGILDFIKKLGPGNKGLVLCLNDKDRSLTGEGYSLIQDTVAKKLEGMMAYTMDRRLWE